MKFRVERHDVTASLMSKVASVPFGNVFGKRDLLAIFHIMKTNLIAEKLPFKCCNPFKNIPDRI